jgi:hypothetical protein
LDFTTELPDLNEAPLLQDEDFDNAQGEDQNNPLYHEGQQATGTHTTVIFEVQYLPIHDTVYKKH